MSVSFPCTALHTCKFSTSRKSLSALLQGVNDSLLSLNLCVPIDSFSRTNTPSKTVAKKWTAHTMWRVGKHTIPKQPMGQAKPEEDQQKSLIKLNHTTSIIWLMCCLTNITSKNEFLTSNVSLCLLSQLKNNGYHQNHNCMTLDLKFYQKCAVSVNT